MAVLEVWRRQDLEGMVQTEYLQGNFFSQDADGNMIGVKVYKDGEPVTLSGSVTGYCVLTSGETISVAGTRTGNRAYITVPQSALAYVGPLGIVIKLIDGSTITTLLSIVATVYRSKTDTVITPSSQIITDWANQISAALQEVEDASEEQDEKIADLQDDMSDLAATVLAESTRAATEENKKVNKPTTYPNGTSGQLLRTNGDGTTTWVDSGLPTDVQVAEAVGNWLDDHPEATTTVQDNSLTIEKLTESALTGIQLQTKDIIYTHRIGSYMSPSKGTCQGFCVHNGVAYECLLWPSDNTKTHIISRSLSTGSVIAETDVYCGHANSMVYDYINDELLVLDGIVNTRTLYTLSPSTLEITGTYTRADGPIYGSLFVDNMDGKVYALGLRNYRTLIIAEVNDDRSIGEAVEFADLPNNYEIQNAVLLNNLLYTFTSANQILIYDFEKQEGVRSAMAWPYIDNIFWLGEIEQWCIDHVTGIVYGNSSQYQGNYLSERHGDFLIEHYTVALPNSYSYNTILTPAGKPKNYAELYATDDGDANYKSSGYEGNPICITEAININPNSGIIITLKDNITDLLITGKHIKLFAAGKSITTLIVEDSDVFISRTNVTNLTAENSRVRFGDQTTTLTNVKLVQSSLECNATIGYLNGSYSSAVANAIQSCNLTKTWVKAEGDIADLQQYVKMSTAYVVTARGRYVLPYYAGKFLPIIQDASLGYDTYLVIDPTGETAADKYKELDSQGSESEAQIVRFYVR